MKPIHDFQARWSVFWATSYGFEPTVFESFLLPRLGEPPLNATVLVDFGRLARTWERLDPSDYWRVRRANHDYLIRGVPINNGAFHPKTYFFANQKEGVLLVGSGNISLYGLELGHEVFSRFSSQDDSGSAAIGGWLDWMGRIVTTADDPMLTNRWLDLRGRASWATAALKPSIFVTNWDHPLIEAFLADLPVPADELHVMAPFYDADVRALNRLVAETQPREVHLYLSSETKVDGRRLGEVLDRQSGSIHLKRFDPAEFVHAKLFAAITGNRARLLSGSANASGPALLSAIGSGGHANAEACTVVDIEASIARAMFTPPGMQIRPFDIAELAQLEFLPDPEEPLPALRLRSAHWLSDGHMVVAIDLRGGPRFDLYVTDGNATGLITGDRTAEPFLADPERVFVWLADSDGRRLSNRVPADDRGQLARRLEQRADIGETPTGLELRDLNHPAGEMLARLHLECIFDFNETSAAQRIKRLPEEVEDPDFWDNFAKEELRQDPRVSRYELVRSGNPLQDDVFLLLEQLLHEAPLRGTLRILGGEAIRAGDGGKEEPRRWTTEQRFQVRLFNVLERWSGALGDPRLLWVDPMAPVRNYAAILAALVECWTQGFLAPDRVVRLVETLLGAFVRTDRAAGYLLTLADDERSQALSVIRSSAAPGVASALAYAALRPGATDVLDRVFRWQPMLVPAIELGVLDPADGSAELLLSLVAETTSDETIKKRLLWAASYIDDEHWCAKMQRDYGFGKVALGRDHPHFGLTLSVDGSPDPLIDSRLISIIRQAFDYRKVDAMILSLPKGRISLRINGEAFARVGGHDLESSQPVTHDLLELLEATGAGIEALLHSTQERAS